MTIVDTLLPEFDHEVATTRKVLERYPDGQGAWKPHAKSFTLEHLASHVATLPLWGEMTVQQPDIDIEGMSAPAAGTTREAILTTFDTRAAAMRAALVGRSDAEMLSPWTLKRAGQTIFTMPKIAVIRSFVMNHLIHHRGQLSVYLRQLDIPLPSIYGPSADENPF